MWEVSAYLSRFSVLTPVLVTLLLVIAILSVQLWWVDLLNWGYYDLSFFWTYSILYDFLIGGIVIITYLTILGFASHRKLTRLSLVASGVMVFLIVLILGLIYPSMMFSASSLWVVAIPPILWWAAALRSEPSLSVFEGKKGPSGLSVAAAGLGTVLVLYVWIRLSMMGIIY